ncbi:MAG: YjjG family noncanonical pyrimidine nucleotidase [Candidatus Cloacimonetes bacterium]|nr:YjjG family noncanonical pyrimidine nucleotidase [Candidatus Cloacimonadota bacterium]
MKQNYSTLLFDADGTLFNYEDSERQALLKTFEHFSIIRDEEDVITGYRLINHELWKKFESGIISLPALRTERFSRLFDSLELQFDPHEFGEIYVQYLGEGKKLLPDAWEIVEKLSASFDLALITNGIAEVQHRRLKASGLIKFFPVVVISEEIGFPKPDPMFFKIALQKLDNLPKENLLIIGDSLTSDIAGGNLSGIDTCWFNPESKKNDTQYIPTYEIKKLTELVTLFSYD